MKCNYDYIITSLVLRWFVMGPARSGSGLHVDPLATSAWNALLAGHKRWALFPPGTLRHHVLPKLPGLEREAVSWFTHVYPLTQRDDWPTAKPIDVIQVTAVTIPCGAVCKAQLAECHEVSQLAHRCVSAHTKRCLGITLASALMSFR